MTSENSNQYVPADIEAKWRERWEQDGLYHSDIKPGEKKHYALTMLPYPSGNLHIGHWYAMVPSDARARFKRMSGFNVLFPMGFDAFGLPAENAAIQNNIHPKHWTFANIEHMRGQVKSMGNMIDWRREAISANESYYRWTQWFFIKLLSNDLAYRKMSAVDWCPQCNTTLAREQVWGDDRHCQRCQTPVIKKDLKQWFFRTTRYTEELLRFEGINWPDRVKTLQDRWIGRSEGAEVDFTTEAGDKLRVFTTRPDTLWGATFMVLAPEHSAVASLTTPEQQQAVTDYISSATRQTDIERKSADKEKTGVFTGGFAMNPVNGEKIPVWIADYVLMGYGTGAIMAVPAHDSRDFDFARKYGIEIRPVIQPEGDPLPPVETWTECVPATGTMVNSGQLSGTPGDKAFDLVVKVLQERGTGERAINYNLHDWLISRQRYWGCPIPVIHCGSCGPVGVPDDQLPVTLPEDVEWLPTGESPLKLHPNWRKVDCPKCGAAAERETDTMDTFMCSSWYHLRYLSPDYAKGPFDPEEYNYWMPVDTYTGGIEHATMHLIYTRFFHKASRDMGITQGDEPMTQLWNQGMVLGEDGEKMSKSRGNVVNPDNLIAEHGTDTVRCYIMFFARWDQGGPWSGSGISGAARWLNRVYSLFTSTAPEGKADKHTISDMRRSLHQTIAQVTRDLERFSFNTAIAALMKCQTDVSQAAEKGAALTPEWEEVRTVYLRLLAPFAPHLAEELWQQIGQVGSVHVAEWPQVDEEAAADEVITLVIQVNGKVRDKLTVAADISRDDAQKAALASKTVQGFIGDKTPRRVIVVPGKLVNIVV